MDRENLWTRRSNSSKLSLSMNNSNDSHDGGSTTRPDPPSRTFSASKRFGGGDTPSGSARPNPFNAMSPLTTTNISSPTSSASNAFGLGSGAFASFGSAAKTPKTPGTAFDFSKAAMSGQAPSTPGAEKRDNKGSLSRMTSRSAAPPGIPEVSSTTPAAPVALDKPTGAKEQSGKPGGGRDGGNIDPAVPWPLKYAWVIWYRPPTSKNSDYEKSIQPMCRMASAQDFWSVYVHLKRPSSLPTVSDYHFFKEGIRPVWEDEENRRGGKWIMRLKKGVADRYWEDLLLAMIGDQFLEAGEEVCGAVLSVRSGEDVFSIWTKNDGGRNIKIRYVCSVAAQCQPTPCIIPLPFFPPSKSLVNSSPQRNHKARPLPTS
ncbi:translation initiation factor eIF 4e-like domain-containing protein [Lineolata rhizophorae]|uniref:Translation initiation factor eIF 4e-like domain-containing protein n=1 Tax=Lineolata rhizophorae TaxID=578093 RepID=A0A6A6NUW3_9PEZI|nr:translation initiation factor eIF 4e-like domain-containing protein [Lineolata rhizophorae]